MMEKERENRTKIIGISIAVIALIIVGGLLAFCQPETELQRKIDREISQLGTGDRFEALRALVEIGKPAVPALIEALQDKGNPVTRRWQAAKALGAIKDARAVEPLIKAMSDESEFVRRVAAESLGKLGDKRAIPVLKEALKDKGWHVRRSAAEALKKLEIEAKQKGGEYPVADQKLQKKIPSRDIVVKSEKLYKKGIQLWREDEIDEAIETLREVVDKYPETNRAGCALISIGKIYMGQSDYQEAIESFKEAIEKHPSSRYGEAIVGAYACFYLGKCYIREERWDEAKKILNQLLEKYPESTDPVGRKLAPHVRSLLEEIEPKEINSFHLPKVKLQRKQEKILLTSEEKAKALYTLGENYQLNKMYHKAIKEYEKLIKEYPKTTWAEKAGQRIKEIKAK